MSALEGIHYVRPPELEFSKIDENDDYTEYKIKTFKDSKEKNSDNIFIADIDSMLFCDDTFKIKMPKKNLMIKDGKKRFAYAVGMFPNPKTGEPSYLDGCILAGLGLKRQKTNADIICFITHDISKKDKTKLEVVFDKVIYVPYISPYDMGGKGKLKTILTDPDLFKNCPNYTKSHPYVHVFFKLHLFNPEYFPYEKVCFVDSDLVPLNFYDSLFMLNTPAGWVENRKKIPYSESFHWDRCDFLKHGKLIPKIFTDIDQPGGSDVNAGLLLITPNKKEYDEMIHELKQPIKKWMGVDKVHSGFYTFDFSTPSGRKFVKNSYCYPEQNYLTKRYSGKWTYIEHGFQSWALDPCNAFGIHMAAFNPKPWFKQPAGIEFNLKEKIIPYFVEIDKDIPKFLPKAFISDNKEGIFYENISYSYEIFNGLIVWGLLEYPKLHNFFMNNLKIYGPKISFDRDIFKPLNPINEFLYLKNIRKKSIPYHKLSISQKRINNLLVDYDYSVNKIKDDILSVCRKKKINRYGERSYNPRIIEYNQDYIEKIKAQTKKKYKSKKNTRKNTRKRTKKKQYTKVIYFYKDNCKFCKDFNQTWNKLKKLKNIHFVKINGDKNKSLLNKYNIEIYPTIIKIKNNKSTKFPSDDRNLNDLKNFIKK